MPKLKKKAHPKAHKPAKKAHKSSKAKKPSKAKSKVERVMREYKHGELHSGSKKGPKVKSRKQAIAIALSESRKAGAKTSKKK